MPKLYYLGQPGDGYGWGVANTNLIRELGKLCEVVVDNSQRVVFDAPCFVPISDSSLNARKCSAPKTLGYCFTEWPLTEQAKKNSRNFDLIFCGSEWNTKRLLDHGIRHAATLQQGVDFGRFQPQPPAQKKGFVVFSGGKYEYRKGQDYVLAAMRVFMKHNPDVVLITAWHNPWPESMKSMQKSWLIADLQKPMDGIDTERVVMLPAMPNEKMAGVYAMTNVGLFPNRCEAGTNLVMSEYMACARPVIASYAHGHRDVLNGDGPMRLETGSYDPAGWFNPVVSDMLYWLEWSYHNRAELAVRGQDCRKLIEPFTWEACARKIYHAAFA